MPTLSEIPPELAAELEKPRKKVKADAHSLTLVYCEHNGPATVDELLVYIWQITGEVKSRGYMYHVLKRLRDRGHIARLELESEPVVRHMITEEGLEHIDETGLKFLRKGDTA